MIKKYNEFINEGIFDLLSGYSMEDVKEKLKHLTPVERYKQIKKLNLTYQDVYTQDEINIFTGLEKNLLFKRYEIIGDIVNNKIRIRSNEKYGIIDINGNEITPIKYDWLEQYHDGFAKVEINNKYGYIDENGNEITPIKYDFLGFFNHNNIAKVRLNGKYGIIDNSGKEITAIIYDYIVIFDNIINGNIAKVMLKNDLAYIDKDGNEHWY